MIIELMDCFVLEMNVYPEQHQRVYISGTSFVGAVFIERYYKLFVETR